VNDPTTHAIGDKHTEPVRVAQPAYAEVLLHRVPHREQADCLQTLTSHRLGRRVSYVDERHIDRGANRVRDLMHRVGAQHENLRTCAY
jgi:hypothetical protein